MQNTPFVDIILPLAIDQVYTYQLPASIPMPPVGVRVIVPLGKKQIMGVLLQQHTEPLPEGLRIREIIEIVDPTPIITQQQLQLWQWIASYYMCTLGEVMTAALPAGIIDDDFKARTTEYITLHHDYHAPTQLASLRKNLKRAKAQDKMLQTFISLANEPSAAVERRLLIEASGVNSAILRILMDKNILCQERKPISRLRHYNGHQQPINPLNEQQQHAVQQIQQIWQTKAVTLLHGVTSSGKTEVYIHLINHCLQQGKQVLYLVPEIALTTQLTSRLQAVFADQVLVYHSRFSNDERVEIYHQVKHSKNLLVLGVRSSVFLPFSNLGLVIVDEEHEPSYKQQDPAPRYHARSVAVMMAQWYGAKVLLGTATPSIESYYNTTIHKYGLVEMTERFRGVKMPQINIIDLQRQYHRKEMYGHFADPLVFRIREEIAKGKQVILFQNRRGYAPCLQCPTCGYVPHCPNCDVSMTYHKADNMLVCHSCGSKKTPPTHCHKCGTTWRLQGVGTERLEEEIQHLFPAARVARMDLDTTRRKDAYQNIIDRFQRHDVDILIGTQMITKGLHFDDVSLVAVLQADMLLNQPDFRSTERAYQMLEQVAGRAGRTEQQGEVIIQTFNPTNPIYALLQHHDYKTLFTQQANERHLFSFPPFYRLILLTLRHRDEKRLENTSIALMNTLKNTFGNRVSQVITPLVARRQNQYIRQLRLRIETEANFARAKQLLNEHVHRLLQQPTNKGTTIFFDVDP